MVIGGLFLMELFAVMIQVGYFLKMTRRRTGTGKRVFKMTPIHFHFDLLGWSEANIVIRFSIIAGLSSHSGSACSTPPGSRSNAGPSAPPRRSGSPAYWERLQ